MEDAGASTTKHITKADFLGDAADFMDDESIPTAKLEDEVVTNAKLAVGAGEPGGDWNSWTPTFSNLSGGTLNFAKYKRLGNTVNFRIKYTLGGAGVSGGLQFTLPVALNSEYSADSNGRSPIGRGILRDSSAGANIKAEAYINGTSSDAELAVVNTNSTYASYSATSPTVPFTWASGDTINISGFYEA